MIKTGDTVLLGRAVLNGRECKFYTRYRDAMRFYVGKEGVVIKTFALCGMDCARVNFDESPTHTVNAEVIPIEYLTIVKRQQKGGE